jgi:signal transduction histidine kinase
MAAVLLIVLRVPPVVVFVAAAVAVLVLPASRRMAMKRLETALFSDVRAQIALDAAENERARLARELHDVPLQHLTSVIRHLEVLPDAVEQTEHLRVVARQLRDAATDLRPPVLDDLGLGAALEFLAGETRSEGIRVTCSVSDAAGPDSSTRLPAEVELAVYRIAQEAVANALRHAPGAGLQIGGEVSADSVVVTVRDDGAGLDRARATAATREGRLGLASMRRRAEAIDADLTISGEDPRHGTLISVRWQR